MKQNTALGRLEDQSEDFTARGLNQGAPAIWEDGQRLTDLRPGAYEWWYMDGHFSNGMMLVASFFTYVGAEGKLIPRLDVNLSNQDGILVNQVIDFDPEEFSAAKDKADVEIKSSYFRSVDGLNAYEIFVEPSENDGFGFNVRLDTRAPCFRPGTGHWSNDADDLFFAWLCVVPEGEMSGTVTYEGETIEVAGSGYHDHNWGNCAMDELLGRWYWGRANVDGTAVVAATVWFNATYGNAETHTLMLARDGTQLLNAVNAETEHLDGTAMVSPDTGALLNSDALEIHVASGSQVRFKGAQIVATSRAPRSNEDYISAYTRFAATTTLDVEIDGTVLKGSAPSVLEYIDFFTPKD